jgi:hypothetical protein
VRTLVRLAGLLRFEDILMALLAVVVLPALDRWLDGDSAAGSSGEPTVVAGLLGLLAVGGVLACVLTRGPDEPSPLADGQMTLQGWARFPLAAGVAIVATETIPGLGLDPELLVGFAFVATIVGALVHPRLPVVPVAYRRAMVLPMAFVAAAAFDRIIGSGMGELVAEFLGGEAPPEVVALWPLIMAAAATMYAMLVIAPRAIADPGANGFAWAVRFVFLIGSVTIATVLGIH